MTTKVIVKNGGPSNILVFAQDQEGSPNHHQPFELLKEGEELEEYVFDIQNILIKEE